MSYKKKNRKNQIKELYIVRFAIHYSQVLPDVC